jgi:putative MATE family efflux protein
MIFPPKHKKILKIALPAGVNSLLDMLQVITDLIMVGRISPFAVASVGLGLQTLMLVFAILTLFHVGTNALLSRFVGASRLKRASVGLSTLLQFALVVSIPVSILWYFLASHIYVWFNTASEVAILGFDYMQVLTLMMPFIFVKLVFVSALSASGDTKTPMYIKLISIVLNIILNYALIFGHFGFPQLGVLGAGISTVIVNVLELSIYIYLYLKSKMVYTPYLYFSKSLLKRALKVGIPASIERTLTFSSFMLFTVIISQYSTEILAGYQIGLRVEGLAFMPGIGFTIAAMTLMGQGLGAKNPQMAKDDVILVLKYTSALMFFISLFMIFIPEKIVWLFTNDTQTIKEASSYLFIVGFSQIPLAFNFVLSGALRGAGDSRRTLKINLTSIWLVRIIPAFLLSWYFNSVVWVYYAMITDTLVKAIFLWIAFNKGEWQKIRV